MKINWKSLIFFVAIPLITGGLSALVTMGSMEDYNNFEKPFLSPPAILFPIVWTILFVLMGIASYRVFESNCENKENALTIYFVQLVVNFIWPVLFFNLKAFFRAFLWLLFLWLLILLTIIRFYKCDKISAYLMIPYILWVTFAGYLNFMIFLLN